MSDTPLKALEQKIDDLISLCAELNREIFTLKAEAFSREQEKRELLDKNELAKSKVQAMISRLSTLEQDS